MAEHGRLGPIEWAAKSRPRPGENVCGDRLLAVDVNGTGALIGVLDGLGHGAEAAEAANCGVEVLRNARSEPLDVLVQLCHRALSGTRGAAMTLARIDFRADTLSWAGSAMWQPTWSPNTQPASRCALRRALPAGSSVTGYPKC